VAVLSAALYAYVKPPVFTGCPVVRFCSVKSANDSDPDTSSLNWNESDCAVAKLKLEVSTFGVITS
jgi:hypothetical protein